MKSYCCSAEVKTIKSGETSWKGCATCGRIDLETQLRHPKIQLKAGQMANEDQRKVMRAAKLMTDRENTVRAKVKIDILLEKVNNAEFGTKNRVELILRIEQIKSLLADILK